jgi:hypothetical protein
MSLRHNRNIIEVRIAGEVLAIVFDVLLVLFLELIRDSLVIDKREDELLVVGGVNGVTDDICAFEKVRVEVFEAQGHTDSIGSSHVILLGLI